MLAVRGSAPVSRRRPAEAAAAAAAGRSWPGRRWRSSLSVARRVPLPVGDRPARAVDVGLVTQSWGGWAGDVGEVAGDRRRGRRRPAARPPSRSCGASGARWWLPGAGAAVVDRRGLDLRGARSSSTPLFNRFTALPPGPARDDVLELAAQAGLNVGRGATRSTRSRRTTAANAYVTGLGRTKRVVLYDTLIEDFTPRRDAARRRPRARATSATATCHRRLCFLALSAPARRIRGRQDSRLAPPNPTPGPAALPALALSLAVAGARRRDDRRTSLSRRGRAPRRQPTRCRLTGDSRTRSSTSSAGSR